MFSGLNTSAYTIRFEKFGRVRIRILFGFRNMAEYEYEYEYYSGPEIWPNTNTNIIRSATFVRIRIRIRDGHVPIFADAHRFPHIPASMRIAHKPHQIVKKL